ncbi:fungal-specific transcription factor domain-containing protein [Neohortaea acidophila]|uniref:Fungal-specific transcription factor domain-containing protein n=1 Tax=Neohortaea acidophila TaxID=245834 RepID=A0A6A6PF60_9PEZI|nr:fungal-specific transcription factor domain-containing protein [Neohortaea acidophila]KAF2478619.1 fungal-specific transcription factor domain-containing protein [Neohortaea acidophila]
MALRYYIQSFASTLSTNAENNGFLSILLPMAMTDAPLMDTLVAWSTSHLAIRQQNVQVKALEDRSVALRSFATNLRDLPPLTCLAICLVLTSMEAVLGNTLSWYSHLSAAARIINSTVSPRLDDSSLASSLDSSAEGRWLLRNFSYHDILASVSRSRAMLIPGLDFLGADAIQVPDTYLGFGVPPMKLLGEINVLSQTLTNYENTSNTASAAGDSSDAAEIAARLYAIEAELRQWRADGSPDDPLIMLADSYRSAILICLYRALRYHRLADPTTATQQIQAEVGEIVTRITSLPHGSSPECTLLFPLFMAGGEAQSTEHRAAIENRMETIAENREFQNLREALDVLKEVWSVQSRTTAIDPARPYDWTCVLERRQWDLALS